MAAGFALNGFVTFGLSLHLISLIERLGMEAEPALLVAALAGPAQVTTRVADMALAGRVSALAAGVGAAAAMPLSFLPLAAAPGTYAGSVAFALVHGGANGIITVARAAVPLELFGPGGYGALLGRLAMWQNGLNALAPIAFAALIARAGAEAAVALGAAASFAAALALAALALRVRGATRGGIA
jgi:hypothetical protein